MDAHQLLERGLLVRGVVVDVHVRKCAATLDDEVHEGLECGLLSRSVVPPEGAETFSVCIAPSDAEEVLEAAIFDVGVALHVEEKIPGRWRGQPRESAV